MEASPDHPDELFLDGATRETARRLAKHLSTRRRRPGHRRRLPASLPLTRQNPPWTESAQHGLTCTVGLTRDGQLDVDLVADGPHLLIAGTTGSGKSELLKTILTGLTDAYAPHELGLFLVDFKGGATLSPFSGGPHAQAFVTDLTHESAQRMLACLRYEVRRREHVLSTLEASDFTDYRLRCAEATSPSEPMPRLVIAVDEFRVLAEELPEALTELLRIAAVGRSLGMHLLLATQRPQGIITQDIRANINTTLCLRLQSAFDAQDLVGTDEPALISAETPGRGIIRRGGREPQEFQAASSAVAAAPWTIAELTSSTARSIEVHAEPAPISLPPRQEPPAGPRPQLFSPALPDSLHALSRSHLRSLQATDAPGQTHLALGLLDDVSRQRHSPLLWSCATMPRLALIGGPLANYAQFVRRVALGACSLKQEHHVYLADGAGWLAGITEEATPIPRLAGWATPAEPSRLLTLFDVLNNTASQVPRLLIVTGLAEWAGALSPPEYARCEELLALLARTAESRGLAVIAAGDRDLTSSRFFPLAEHRLYNSVGLGPETTMSWPRLTPTRPVPLRCAYTGPETDPLGLTAQLLGDEELIQHGDVYPEPTQPMSRCIPLPSFVRAPIHGGPTSRPHVGIASPDHRPWHWNGEQINLILGHSGSGKTTLLQQIHQQLPDSLIWTGHEHVSDRPATVLVDDADQLTGECRSRLESWCSQGTTVVMTARPSAQLFARLPLAQAARQSGTGILLGARSPHDGDFWGWRVAPTTPAPPGRALTIIDGELTWAQAWAPEEAVHGVG
ncbi:ATP-binding protein [Zhihengliuella flava]|uniref:Energy-coupling factor transporter ATP-binding protein EcfA2 n=1 Tax=Zhihengliuella flava TaxID=1285193 RepID=A0A931GHX4_9MICC|nr:energy-coupling factor transporter ATP-binding protein EcfA2 [Zhihengliuella flava]